MRALTFTDESAVTVVSALSPVFVPHVAFETPLTLKSAACTFLGQPAAHLRPDTSRMTVFSLAATTSAVEVAPIAAGAAIAPAVNAAQAAIMVMVVFISLIGCAERAILPA